MLLSGLNIGIAGIKKEASFNVNAIPDFTDVAEPKCNPVFFNEDASFGLTINDLDNGTSKTLNGMNALKAGDFNSGRFTYDLTFGGDLQDNAMGFLIETAVIHSVYNVDTMEYRIDTTDKACNTDSYSFYIPFGCAVNKVASDGFVFTGCRPLSFKITGDGKTYEVTFRCASFIDAPATTQLPVWEDGHYYTNGLTFADMKKTPVKLELEGTEIDSTTQCDLEINYEYDENKGFFNSEGVETSFKHKPIVSKVMFAGNYDTTPSASNNTALLLANHKDRSKVDNLKMNVIDDSTHSIITEFSAVVSDHSLATPGADISSLSATYNHCANEDGSYAVVIKHKDEYGDITSNL